MMECLLFLWWNFALYLACYLHDTLHCNIYMDGTMCMDGTSLCMNNVYGWNWCDMWYETYVLDMWYGNISIYVIYICCENCWIKKNRKKRQYAASLPSATDGKGLFAISSGWQRGHVAGNCASWEADQFGQFAHSGWRHRLCRPQRTAKACR